MNRYTETAKIALLFLIAMLQVAPTAWGYWTGVALLITVAWYCMTRLVFEWLPWQKEWKWKQLTNWWNT